MSRKRVRREYLLDDRTLRMTDRDGKTHDLCFEGIDSEVYLKLAMIGAGSLLCKVDDIESLWEKIWDNKFGPQRKYADVPKIVSAISRSQGVRIEVASDFWRKATKEEKERLKNSPIVKKELLKMKIEEIDSSPPRDTP